MKANAILKTILVGLLTLTSTSGLLASRNPEASVSLDARLSNPYISHRGGSAFLHISLATADHRREQRKPMNIAVVLDRSGSMEDEGKMGHARAALHALIDKLAPEDFFSLVVYDHAVDVLWEAQRVGQGKRELRRIVDRVYPRGSTNLGGGMVEGFRQVGRFSGREYVNRVVLISDGLANQGVTDPVELARIARTHRSRSISLTAIGMGLDYNENLMMSLSESGGGNYYFMERSHNMAGLLEKEFSSMSSVLAQNASIEITPGRGVRIRDVVGCEFRRDRDRYVIHVGDIYANETREFTVELDVPEGTGSLLVAKGSLTFEPRSVRMERPRSFAVHVRYSRDLAVIERNRDFQTQAKVDIALSTKKVEEAMKALDEGNEADASIRLEEARNMIVASPAAAVGGTTSEALSRQAERLSGFKDTLEANRDNTARAKKQIQYENYRQQRNK